MKSEKKPIDFALPLRHFVGILFFFVIAVTCLQVISRYVFDNPLIWSEESVRFMVVWMCMVGSAVSNFDDDHMMINIIVEKFPRPVQFVMYTVRQLLIVVFCVACSYYSIPLLKAAGSDQLGATVGLAVQALMTVLRWFNDLGRFRRGEFCLKDADTEVAESVSDTEIPPEHHEGGVEA